jgi:hypothetical protein
MKLTSEELHHLVFLSEVVLRGKKRGLMEETLQCLLYIVKSVEEAELPDSVVERIRALLTAIEADLRSENERMQEIRHRLDSNQLSQRKPFG